MKKLLISLIAFFILVPKLVSASVPGYTGFVNDKTGTLTAEEVKKLEAKLTEYDKQTTNQIAVLLVDTTATETIEEFGIHVFDAWKPGVKGQDNGILMTFAISDRKMRIDVGRGLEGKLTDVQSKHIIDDIMVPEFKSKSYYTGIDKGIDKVMVFVSPDAPIASQAAKADDIDGTAVLFIIIVLIIVFLILVAISPFTPLGGEGSWGITGGWSSSGGDGDSGSGFGGFGGGSSSGGGASGSW